MKLMCTRTYACTVVILICSSSSRLIHCGSTCHFPATQVEHTAHHATPLPTSPLANGIRSERTDTYTQVRAHGSYTLTCSHNLSPPAPSLPSLPSPSCSAAPPPAAHAYISMLPTEPPRTAHIVVSSAHLFRLRVANAPHEEVDHHRELAQHRDHL